MYGKRNAAAAAGGVYFTKSWPQAHSRRQELPIVRNRWITTYPSLEFQTWAGGGLSTWMQTARTGREFWRGNTCPEYAYCPRTSPTRSPRARWWSGPRRW